MNNYTIRHPRKGIVEGLEDFGFTIAMLGVALYETPLAIRDSYREWKEKRRQRKRNTPSILQMMKDMSEI